MPNYLFKHPEKEEYIEVFFHMNDEKIYIDENGTQWERRWTVPNASVDSISDIDPFDTKKFVEKTGKMKGDIGNLWDISKEASDRRADKVGGEDPIKKKYFKDYKKENGINHWHDRPSKIETKHATINLDALKKKP